MKHGLGLYGFMARIEDKIADKRKAECEETIDEEMSRFCASAAEKYGIIRGQNLLQMQVDITNKGWFDEKVSLKNEETADFLEKEKEELIRRRDAMFDRISKLPLEGTFDKAAGRISAGRNSDSLEKGGYNERLENAEEYLENNGLNFPTEEYLQRVYHQAGAIIDEVEKDIGINQKGAYGESYVNEQLKLYENKYHILQNIVIRSEDSQGKTSEVDTYIITEKGLIVVETKNYGNERQRLHITRDGRWTLEDIRTGKVLKVIDHSPVAQNARHCLAVERLIEEKFGRNCGIPVIPVVFIANNKVAIQNDSTSHVIRVSEFYSFIQNTLKYPAIVSEERQQEIEELLKENNIGAQNFTVKSRMQKMRCIEEIEHAFTQYVLYNQEVADYYKEMTKKYCPKVKMPWWILAIPYIPIIFLLDLDTIPLKIAGCVIYSIGIFSIPLAILAVIVVLYLDVILSSVKFIIGILILGALCGGLTMMKR